MNREIKSLPMVALRGMTIMPEMVVHFDVSREKSIAAIQEAMAGDQKIFLVAQKSIETDDPTQEDVYEVGTVGTIKQIMKLPKHIVRVLVSGETRGILKQLQQDTPYLRAEVEVIDESDLVIQDDQWQGVLKILFWTMPLATEKCQKKQWQRFWRSKA